MTRYYLLSVVMHTCMVLQPTISKKNITQLSSLNSHVDGNFLFTRSAIPAKYNFF
jgi:hypothetical protein